MKTNITSYLITNKQKIITVIATISFGIVIEYLAYTYHIMIDFISPMVGIIIGEFILESAPIADIIVPLSTVMTMILLWGLIGLAVNRMINYVKTLRSIQK